MKKIILTLFICTISAGVFSQTDTWTKADRNNLYEDCMSYITKYKNITNDQKESICLCYLEEVTKKYTKTDFQAKIDIELKRVKEAVISQCAKNLGIDLSTAVKTEEVADKKGTLKNKPKREDLIGKWKTDKGSIMEFKEDGKYAETTVKNVSYSGDWFLDDKGVLTIDSEEHYTQILTKKEKVDRKKSVYDFDNFSTDYLKFTREGLVETIQANRMK